MNKSLIDFQISLPSKTFLLGEYLVLDGGPGFLMNTDSRFVLSVNSTNTLQESIELPAPASLLFDKQSEHFSDYHWDFHDPHQQQGGLGASTACFAALWLAKSLAQQKEKLRDFAFSSHQLCWSDCEALFQLDVNELFQSYQSFAWDGEGFRPSGADLMSQIYGFYAHIADGELIQCHTKWPFQNLELLLLRTGNKVATHQHLHEGLKFSSPALHDIVNAGIESFNHGDEHQWIECINAYSDRLEEYSLIHSDTLELLKQVHNIPGLKAAKGCGALGADVLCLIADRDNMDPLHEFIKKENLSFIANESNISEGIKVMITERTP